MPKDAAPWRCAHVPQGWGCFPLLCPAGDEGPLGPVLLPLLPPEVWAALCSRSLLELPGASSTQAGLWSCGPLPSSAAVSVSLGGRPHPPATPSPPSWPVLDGPRGPRAVPAAPAVPPGCVPPSSLPGEEGGADPELSELGPPQGCCPPPAPSPLCEAQCSRWVRAGNKTTRVCEPSVSGRGRGGGGMRRMGVGGAGVGHAPFASRVIALCGLSAAVTRAGPERRRRHGRGGRLRSVRGGTGGHRGGGEGPGPAARHRGSGGRGRWSAGRGGVRAWDRRGLRGCRGRVVAGGGGAGLRAAIRRHLPGRGVRCGSASGAGGTGARPTCGL